MKLQIWLQILEFAVQEILEFAVQEILEFAIQEILEFGMFDSIHYRVPRKDARRFALSLCSGSNKLLALRDAQRRDTKKSSRPKLL